MTFLVSGTKIMMKTTFTKHKIVVNSKVPSKFRLSKRSANVLRAMNDTIFPKAKMYEVTNGLISGGRISTVTGQQIEIIPILEKRK